MNRRSFVWMVGGTAALTLGVPRFGGRLARAREATDLAALGLPEVTITVDDKGYAVSPATTPAGWTLVTFDNQQGQGDNSADLMLIPTGESIESLLASIGAPDAPPPAWVFDATFAGAPWAPAGASEQALVLLTAGDWAVFSPAPLAPAALTVTEGDEAAATPPDVSPDREVDLQEFAFMGLEGTIPAGPQLWKVTNTGRQPHLMTVSPLPVGTTQAQFMESVMAMMSGTPPPDAAAAPGPPTVGGSSTLSAGQSLYLALDLAAGTYGAVCFFPDAETGAPHVALGMAQVFAVE